MVGKNLVGIGIVGVEWELKALVLSLTLLALQHIEQFDVFLRVDHATSVIWMDCQVLIINDNASI